MIDVVMPRLSDSMEEGTVLSWLKSVGDEISRGDELVEIETDKANMIYQADASGTLVEILAEEGATLPIGDVIARIGASDEAPASDGGKRREQAAVERSTSDNRRHRLPPMPTRSRPPADGRVKASPLARRVARDRGVDIASLSGSGPGARIIKADVERAAEAEASVGGHAGATPAAEIFTAGERDAGAGEVTTVELSKLQRTVARRMAESKAAAPHFYLECEVDMTLAVEARTRLRESVAENEAAPTYNDMVVKAAALALSEHPRVNSSYRDGRIEQYSRINIGVAVAADDALVVPNVFDADRKGLRRIAAETLALSERVRDGRITEPELSNGTFTVSNLGMFGITAFHGVINPPQAAILSVGALREVPAFDRAGGLCARRVVQIGLACDHRVIYGADGARFLERISELLSEPLALAL